MVKIYNKFGKIETAWSAVYTIFSLVVFVGKVTEGPLNFTKYIARPKLPRYYEIIKKAKEETIKLIEEDLKND